MIAVELFKKDHQGLRGLVQMIWDLRRDFVCWEVVELQEYNDDKYNNDIDEERMKKEFYDIRQITR